MVLPQILVLNSFQKHDSRREPTNEFHHAAAREPEGGAGGLPSGMAAIAEAVAFSPSDWRGGALFAPAFELKRNLSLLVEPIERRRPRPVRLLFSH